MTRKVKTKDLKKKDMVHILSEDHDLSLKQAREILETVFKTILNHILTGGTYEHTGFGKFLLKELKKRTIHNVNLRELTKLPKKKTLRFVPSRRLNQKLNASSKPKGRNKK